MKFAATGVSIVLAFAMMTPGSALGQPPARVAQIGVLSNGFPPSSPQYLRPRFDAFLQGLRALGYVEGQNIAIHWRFAAGRDDQLPVLADELIRLPVAAIVAANTPAALALKQKTKTIPIIFAASADPVGSGLVAGLARPGGNVTGLSIASVDVYGKGLQLLKEAVPKLTRVAVLYNPTNPASVSPLSEIRATAPALRVQVLPIEARDTGEIDAAFSRATSEHVHALMAAADTKYVGQRARLADLAAKAGLPTMFWTREFAEVGGFMTYGPSLVDLFRRAATYVDKILKGANPADLPVEEPTKFELVVNLKTAKTLGLTIPRSVLVRADEVID